ncbi:PEP-CTERM sorting domain-containing protein [Luteolibacter soli]|uniref:PEP-CTERM sorting domain-containing protein n=1 Tax=Luteolibacter soli TaxID=3135280 RepID=A0ABU9AV08_9BACT
MKIKLKLIALATLFTAALSGTSSAVNVTITGVANTLLGQIKSTDGTVLSGRAIFISSTGTAVADGAAAALAPFLGGASWTSAQFDQALATLVGTPTAGSPGIVRTATFVNGSLTSSGAAELGDVGNNTYLFLVAESAGMVTAVGAFTGNAVPSLGAVTINPNTAGDSPGVGTSPFISSSNPGNGFYLVPEPSTALLGLAGLTLAFRRRRC